jgi:D-xylose transport system substrate-binding protein
MKKTSLISIAAVAAVSMLALAGCSSTPAASTAAGSNRACVILPDADSGTRWESGDRPALDKALKAAGYETDIQNAQKDANKYATIADAQLAKGCGVMLLVDFQGAAVAVAEKAKKQGIPVIAYDRPIDGADYYVSFDNTVVGQMEGQSVLDGLAAEGKDPKTASIVYGSGDPTDGNAKMFLDGALSVLNAAGAKAAFTMKGTWDGPTAGTEFEQAFTALKGKVDAVLSPNDNNAAAIIAILDKNNMKVPVSGQDASVAGLQNVLLGKQTATVYKPFSVEADAASKLAIDLLSGKKPTEAKSNNGVPFLALSPILIKAADVVKVVTAGDAKASDICTADVAAACAKYGVK